MLTKPTFAVVTAVLALGLGAYETGANAAPPEFALAGPIKIKQCQIIDESGSYRLVDNLPGAGGFLDSGNCIEVTVGDVVLDLAGQTISGSTGIITAIGILIEGSALTNVEVHNGTVRDFLGEAGISAPDLGNQGFRIINVRVVSNAGNGIFLQGAGHLVKDNTVVDNGTVPTAAGNDGIFVGDSGATVTGNTAFGNARNGILSGIGSTVTGNTAANNQRGIRSRDNSTVAYNTVTNNSVGISAASNSLIYGNTASNNTTGIGVNFRNLVKGNILAKNQEGIFALGDFNVFEENLLVGNTNGGNAGGILLGNSANDNFCDNNRFADNTNDVLKIGGAVGTNPFCSDNTVFD